MRMHTLSLFFGLLWRTFVHQLIVSLAILALIGVTGAGAFHRYEKFIVLKPTLIYSAFALALLIGWLGPRVNLVRAVWGTVSRHRDVDTIHYAVESAGQPFASRE